MSHPFLSRSRPERSRIQGVSLAFLWQMQSGALFLGQLRSGCDAVFRTGGAATSRWDPASARCNYARGVLPGGEQPRFLARERRRADADFLFVRLSRTIGIQRGEGPAGSSLLRTGNAGVHVAI